MIDKTKSTIILCFKDKVLRGGHEVEDNDGNMDQVGVIVYD